MLPQTTLERFRSIIKYHGIFCGIRRVFDQIFQIELYDWVNSVDTRSMLSGDQYFAALTSVNPAAVMHYQPTYTATIKRPLKSLMRKFPVVGASSTCLIDLGCGSGKVLHIAQSMMIHVNLIGIDIHPQLLSNAASNFRIANRDDSGMQFNKLDIKAKYKSNKAKLQLLLSDVNDVSFEKLLEPFDVVVVHNKNSFDKKTTLNSFQKIRAACEGKSFFYLYNNPVFDEIFDGFQCIYQLQGWHKNWNVKLFKIC